MTKVQRQLINLLKKASTDKNTNIFEYRTEWLFDWPSHSISINGLSLHKEYLLPHEYSLKDLNELEHLGFIIRVDETEEDITTLEKTITYKIIEAS